MAQHDYVFLTRWRVRGSEYEVSDILGDAEDLVRWWPSVYLDVKTVQPGDENDIGKVVSLYTKGWLPYTLRWSFRVVESLRPHGFTIEAMGDFVGRGVWSFMQVGEWVDITYDWRIRADKPLLRILSPLMKPIFKANHQWAMAQGEESLRLELARRHAGSDEERCRVPAPPPGTTTSALPLAIATAGALGGLIVAIYLLRKE